MAADRRRGAAQWAMVLSELAAVEVTVGFERPVWLVAWTDGPTRDMVSARVAALGRFGVGAPLAAAELRFRRLVSPRAWGLGWLDHGPPDGDPSKALPAVEKLCAAQPYPGRRPVDALAAADLLAALAGGDAYRMGELVAAAAWPPARPPAGTPPTDLPGTVVTVRWPGRGGPPAELLGNRPGPPGGRNETQRNIPQDGGPDRPAVCAQCGRPLEVKHTGRPAVYCSVTCRSRARRARRPAAGP